MSAPLVEVVLYHLSDEPEAVVAAYHEASRRMAGTPGLLGDKLLRSAADERTFVVVSRWASWEAFAAWEGGERHKDQTAPLRPYRRAQHPFDMYRQIAGYGLEAPERVREERAWPAGKR